MMPFLMPGRNESLVYYEQFLDLSKTTPFIARYNATHVRKITIFHLVMYGIARGLKARPGLDRFVAGHTIYQRKDTHISFAVKREFKDESPLKTVKLFIPQEEPFDEMVERIHQSVHGSRDDKEKTIDKEMRWLLAMPRFVVRLTIRLLRWLDNHNMLPVALTKNDPMYASFFVANLGSVGVDRVWHHLYEYGTVSLFAAIGMAKKVVVPGPNDTPVVRDAVTIRYSFDERVNDGHYCMASLAMAKDVVQDPECFIAPGARDANAMTTG